MQFLWKKKELPQEGIKSVTSHRKKLLKNDNSGDLGKRFTKDDLTLLTNVRERTDRFVRYTSVLDIYYKKHKKEYPEYYEDYEQRKKLINKTEQSEWIFTPKLYMVDENGDDVLDHGIPYGNRTWNWKIYWFR
jgi:hypothetical protein